MATSNLHQQSLKNSRKLLVKLIPRALAPCELDDDAFQSALSYAEYHIKDNRFLDPYPAQVARQCDLLEQSFKRHSQQQKAKAFSQLVSRLEALSSDHPDPDHSCRTLALLLALARNPVGTPVDTASVHAALNIRATATLPGDGLAGPPASPTASATDSAVDAAWAEGDDLSDWDDEPRERPRWPPLGASPRDDPAFDPAFDPRLPGIDTETPPSRGAGGHFRAGYFSYPWDTNATLHSATGRALLGARPNAGVAPEAVAAEGAFVTTDSSEDFSAPDVQPASDTQQPVRQGPGGAWGPGSTMTGQCDAPAAMMLVQQPQRALQYPALPLPLPPLAAALSEAQSHVHHAGDLVADVIQHRGGGLPLLGNDRAERCYASLTFARQILELLQGRSGVMFIAQPSPRTQYQCLCRLETPVYAHLLPGTHLRDTTPSAVARFTHPYLKASDQLLMMTMWIEAVATSAGVNSEGNRLPSEVLTPDCTVCPSLAAFLMAAGQQLDMVGAAVVAIQDRLQHLEAWDSHLLGGMLLWLDNMCRPVLRRLARLHSIFSRPLRDVFELVSRIGWDQQEADRLQASAAAAPSAASPRSAAAGASRPNEGANIARSVGTTRRWSESSKGAEPPLSLASAGVTKALVDSLHDMLLETECLGSRHGRTQRGILLHIMLATLRPTLEGIDHLLREGTLYEEHHHMFLRFDRGADPCSVDFWESACTLCTSGGLQLVPRCLLGIARRVASAGKAVAVLHMHERVTAATARADAGAGPPHLAANLMRAVIQEVNQLVTLSSQWAEVAEVSSPPLLTALMAAAGELLANMHQPDETAEGTLLHMLEAMDDGSDAGDGDTAAPAGLMAGGLLGPGRAGGEGMMAPLGAPDLAAHLDPVGVLEKIEWMRGGRVESATAQQDLLAGLDRVPEGGREGVVGRLGGGGGAEALAHMVQDINAPADLGDHDRIGRGLDNLAAVGPAAGLGPGAAAAAQAAASSTNSAGATRSTLRTARGGGEVTAGRGPQGADRPAAGRVSRNGPASGQGGAGVGAGEVSEASLPVRQSAAAAGTESVVSVQGSFSHLPHTLTGLAIEPPSAVPSPCRDTCPDGGAEPVEDAMSPRVSLQQAASAAAAGGGLAGVTRAELSMCSQGTGHEAWEAGSDSSSDFSYGSSSGSEAGGCDAAERQLLREARKALQVARKAAWKASAADGDALDSAKPCELPGTAADQVEFLSELPLLDPEDPWAESDLALLSAAESWEPVPPVDTHTSSRPSDSLPCWASAAGEQLRTASAEMSAASAYLDYTTSHTRSRLVHEILPGGTSMPAFLPVHGSQGVGARMAQATEMHVHGDDVQIDGAAEQSDAVWLQHVEAEMLPPMDTVVQRCLVATIQDCTTSVGLALSRHLLGTWGLRRELQRVRGVLLMASQAAHTWADRLCLTLNQGVHFSDPEAAQQPLHALEQYYHAELESAHARDPTQPKAESVQLSCRVLDPDSDGARLGLGNARSPSITRSQLSQAAYVDVSYSVTWPLSIVISPRDLLRYRQCLPVLLQMHWVKYNLCRTSKALWNSRLDATDPFAIPAAQPGPSGPGTRVSAAAAALRMLTAADAAETLHTMHHAVNVFQRAPLESLADAWSDFQAALSGKESVDLDDISALHTRYLDRVQLACLLSTDRPTQVLVHALYQLLEIALQCTQSIMYVLQPTTGWRMDPGALPRQEQDSPEVLHENRAKMRAAASKASRLSIRFKQEIAYIVTLLCSPHLPNVAGTSTVHLLNALNFNGFFNDIIAQERQKQ